MNIGLANIILDINIILSCVSFMLNMFVLISLIYREKAYRRQDGDHEGGHIKR